MWKNDDELFSLMKHTLYTAVVGDILDVLGYQHQFLPPAVKPVDVGMVIAGRAMPVLEADYLESETKGSGPLSGKPFGLMFEALDDLKKNEVYIASGSSPRFAMWGELMSTRAHVTGAAGAVLNGYYRDTNGILAIDFPVFGFGSFAQDQSVRGKVLDFRIAIEIEETRIMPGDIIFGDRDGVLVVPQCVEKELFCRALEKVSTENEVRTAIKNGMTTVAAFEHFGVM